MAPASDSRLDLVLRCDLRKTRAARYSTDSVFLRRAVCVMGVFGLHPWKWDLESVPASLSKRNVIASVLIFAIAATSIVQRSYVLHTEIVLKQRGFYVAFRLIAHVVFRVAIFMLIPLSCWTSRSLPSVLDNLWKQCNKVSSKRPWKTKFLFVQVCIYGFAAYSTVLGFATQVLMVAESLQNSSGINLSLEAYFGMGLHFVSHVLGTGTRISFFVVFVFSATMVGLRFAMLRKKMEDVLTNSPSARHTSLAGVCAQYTWLAFDVHALDDMFSPLVLVTTTVDTTIGVFLIGYLWDGSEQEAFTCVNAPWRNSTFVGHFENVVIMTYLLGPIVVGAFMQHTANSFVKVLYHAADKSVPDAATRTILLETIARVKDIPVAFSAGKIALIDHRYLCAVISVLASYLFTVLEVAQREETKSCDCFDCVSHCSSAAFNWTK